ncbi:RidA family protein [uncultured Sulfitobacter sp.]|uniref:RidA family protein n=1 Tax=uncultured Sulfitobacter sp. TaxID=191468 RepID=UPI00262F73B5|nr:RidA family protein [uncultured Sulfitobacter sp.]
MKTREINPTTGIYPATRDYVHAMEVTGASRQLFVSGTMGLAEDGSAPASLDEQLKLIWTNIQRILTEAEMSVSNIVRLTSYLARPEYAERNQTAREKALGGRAVPTTAIVVTTLDPSWLVEIEVIAMS